MAVLQGLEVNTMFASLSDRLGGVLQKVRGQGRISEANIKDTLREVRMADRKSVV